MTGLAGPYRARERSWNWLWFAGSALFFALWAAFILPHFFGTPTSLQVCGKPGVCTQTEISDYYAVLWTYTGLLVGAGVVFLLVAFYHSYRKGPSRVRVGARGFIVESGSRKLKVTAWEDPGLFCVLWDHRAAIQAHPKQARSSASPFEVSLKYGGTWLTQPAFDSILRSGHEYGLPTETGPGGYRQFDESMHYRLGPAETTKMW